MNIILATRNPSKAEQIRAIFRGGPFTILTMTDVEIGGEAVEDGETLQQNALKKALFVHEQAREVNAWAMADDTGLFITALDGAPGVRAARWAGEDATTDEITRFTLKQLEGKRDRSARFETVVALISSSGERSFFSGSVNGNLLDTPKVRPQPKMPYDPIFVPDGSSIVWAEMTVDQENAISHRGKAFRKARFFLECLQ